MDFNFILTRQHSRCTSNSHATGSHRRLKCSSDTLSAFCLCTIVWFVRHNNITKRWYVSHAFPQNQLKNILIFFGHIPKVEFCSVHKVWFQRVSTECMLLNLYEICFWLCLCYVWYFSPLSHWTGCAHTVTLEATLLKRSRRSRVTKKILLPKQTYYKWELNNMITWLLHCWPRGTKQSFSTCTIPL